MSHAVAVVQLDLVKRPPPQVKSCGLVGGITVGVPGMSVAPVSQRGLLSVWMSVGNEIVCGSLTDRVIQRT